MSQNIKLIQKLHAINENNLYICTIHYFAGI